MVVMDKRMMVETEPAGQINQVELGASDVLLAKGVGVDHLYIDVDHHYMQTNQILNMHKTAKGVGVDHLNPSFNQWRWNTSSFHPNKSNFEDECDSVKV